MQISGTGAAEVQPCWSWDLSYAASRRHGTALIKQSSMLLTAAAPRECSPHPLISVPVVVGCIGAAFIVIAAIATPVSRTQRMREVWFIVMSGGVLLKAAVIEIARIFG